MKERKGMSEGDGKIVQTNLRYALECDLYPSTQNIGVRQARGSMLMAGVSLRLRANAVMHRSGKMGTRTSNLPPRC